jgi:hypothetical protein
MATLVFPKQQMAHILNPSKTLKEWSKLKITEKKAIKENPLTKFDKFTAGYACSKNSLIPKTKVPKNTGIEWPAWSKIAHVNKTDVYVVGGEKKGEAVKSTFKMNVRTGEVERMADMVVAR